MRTTRALAVAGVVGLAACIPEDQSLPLGSVAFELKASDETARGISVGSIIDGYDVTATRVLLSFKTVTIGEQNNPNACSYRGRGAQSDVVFDPRAGIVQTFNGLDPNDCPDVGIIFGPPDDGTVPAAGATSADLFELLAGDPAHALVDLVGTDDFTNESWTVHLRFPTAFTSSHFAGCQEAQRGIQVKPNERQQASMAFGVEAFLRDSLDTAAELRFEPFVIADANKDHVVTMEELDAVSLATVRNLGGAYLLPDSTLLTFGDYVRTQFKFTFTYEGDGACTGNDPGAE